MTIHPPIVSLLGTSKNMYRFSAFPLNSNFIYAGAVYAFLRLPTAFGFSAQPTVVYIGQSSNISSRIPLHEKWPCVLKNGANAIGLLFEASEATRLVIETDLRRFNDPICNKQ